MRFARNTTTTRYAVQLGLLLGWVAVGSGCSSEDLSGYLFDITISGIDDTCTGQPANFSEKVEYRVKVEGQDVELAVGPDVFAVGEITGCFIQYESVVWGEVVDDFEIRWILKGSATMNPGGGGCSPANGTDWDGVESFEVVNSENPEISPGCSYDVALAGKYRGKN